MLNWDSLVKKDWDDAYAKYALYLTTPAKAARDATVTSTNATVVSSMTAQEFYDYLHDTFFVWKYTQKNRLASCRKALEKEKMPNPNLDVVRKWNDIKTKISDASYSDQDLLKVALSIRGLGYAGATALLSTLYPNRFGTIDRFVKDCFASAASLSGDPLATGKDTVESTLHRIALLQDKANDLNRLFKTTFWTPRNVDKAAWADR